MTVKLDAFILSVSRFSDIKDSWGTRNATKEDLKNNHVLFVDDDKSYLNELFENILEVHEKLKR
jgi:hypothetical protein